MVIEERQTPPVVADAGTLLGGCPTPTTRQASGGDRHLNFYRTGTTSTSVSFTLDRYGHLFEGHDAELRDRLDAMHAVGLKDAASGAVLELRPRPFRPVRGPNAGPEQAEQIEGPAAFQG
jgi:hypothetical protein